MARQTDERVTAHKLGQATRLREGVAGPEHLQGLRDEVDIIARRIERLSNQLYVQSVIQTDAIDRVLRVATVHFAQTCPRTLDTFAWRIDAKGREVQRCEQIW